MSENGNEQVNEVTVSADANGNVNANANASQDELLKIVKKQLFFQRISALCMMVIALCVVIVVMNVVPKVGTTLSHINDVALKAQGTLDKVDDMTDGLVQTTEKLNTLVDENADQLTTAVKSISEIDFEGLNNAIADLQSTIGPMASFFGKFR